MHHQSSYLDISIAIVLQYPLVTHTMEIKVDETNLSSMDILFHCWAIKEISNPQSVKLFWEQLIDLNIQKRPQYKHTSLEILQITFKPYLKLPI